MSVEAVVSQTGRFSPRSQEKGHILPNVGAGKLFGDDR